MLKRVSPAERFSGYKLTIETENTWRNPRGKQRPQKRSMTHHYLLYTTNHRNVQWINIKNMPNVLLDYVTKCVITQAYELKKLYYPNPLILKTVGKKRKRKEKKSSRKQEHLYTVEKDAC